VLDQAPDAVGLIRTRALDAFIEEHVEGQEPYRAYRAPGLRTPRGLAQVEPAGKKERPEVVAL
jgi:hypothetical protein